MPLFDALGDTLNKKSWQTHKILSSGSGNLCYDLMNSSIMCFEVNFYHISVNFLPLHVNYDCRKR